MLFAFLRRCTDVTFCAVLCQAERLAKSAVKPVAPVVKKKVIVDDTVRLALELQEKLGGPTRRPKYVLRPVVREEACLVYAYVLTA